MKQYAIEVEVKYFILLAIVIRNYHLFNDQKLSYIQNTMATYSCLFLRISIRPDKTYKLWVDSTSESVPLKFKALFSLLKRTRLTFEEIVDLVNNNKDEV